MKKKLKHKVKIKMESIDKIIFYKFCYFLIFCWLYIYILGFTLGNMKTVKGDEMLIDFS